MFQVSRLWLVTALCAVGVLTVSAAATPDGIEQRKQDVVRGTLEKMGRPDRSGPFQEALAAASALVDIQVDASGEKPVVTLQVTGQPAYKAFPFEDENGKKIVIDLMDTVNLRAGTTFAAANCAVMRQVRTSLFAVEPQFISRVVVDLTAPAAFDISQAAEDRKSVV